MDERDDVDEPASEDRGNHAHSAEQLAAQLARTEHELRREQRLSRRLLDTAREIVLVLDRQGRIVRYNRYMEQLTGVPLTEAKGKVWFDTFIPAHERDRIRSLFHRSLAGEQVQGNINSIMTRNGEERFIEWYDASVDGGDGETVELLALGLDISTRRSLEQHLLTISEEIQLRIGQQLHDDLGQQLVSLKLMLDNHAHSLQQSGSPNLEEALAIGANISAALTSVRMMARGLLPVAIKAPDLTVAFQNLVSQIDGIDGIRCTFSHGVALDGTDDQTATQLYHIAQEAITNALKHSGGSQIEIFVTLHTDHQVVLSVSDNGRGISTGEVETGGTGLRIMRYRTDTIQGHLEVSRNEHGGTRVKCQAPLASAPAAAE